MKAVLFDLFGTLVDNMTNAQVATLRMEMSEVLGIPSDDFAKGWSSTFHDRSRGVGGSVEASILAAVRYGGYDCSEEVLARAAAIRYEHTRDWLTPRTDAVETLQALRDRGLRTGLLSNCSHEVPVIWATHAFAPLIDESLFSCLEGLRKPMPEFYDRAMTRLGVAPAECLYVADGDNGELAAARKLGIPVVMIRPSHLLDDFRTDPEEDWDGPRIERLGELLILQGYV